LIEGEASFADQRRQQAAALQVIFGAGKGDDVSEEIAVVTGASSGIGLELARELAARGYTPSTS
jgi:hypothetical protein